jgi:hypothetical protein
VTERTIARIRLRCSGMTAPISLLWPARHMPRKHGSIPVRSGARHRIVAGIAPRVAPPEAAYRQPAAAQQPVRLQRDEGIL